MNIRDLIKTTTEPVNRDEMRAMLAEIFGGPAFKECLEIINEETKKENQ